MGKAKVFHDKLDAQGAFEHKTAGGTLKYAKVQCPKGKRQRRGF